MSQLETKDRFIPHKRLWPLSFLIGAKVYLDSYTEDLYKEDCDYFSGKRFRRRTLFGSFRYYTKGILVGGVVGTLTGTVGIEGLLRYHAWTLRRNTETSATK